jgi:hypothetical protein
MIEGFQSYNVFGQLGIILLCWIGLYITVKISSRAIFDSWFEAKNYSEKVKGERR